MRLRWQMLELLADGRLRSGQDLAELMGVSRAAIWKHKRSLEAVGLDIEAVRGRGYRLPRPIELLDARRIIDALPAPARAGLGALQVFREIDSTNSYLQRQLAPAPGTADACLAEFQSAGRGRRGRGWKAPFGSGICLSLAWTFAEQPAELSALSLVAGVASLRALASLGLSGLQLKWPNDLLYRGAKLGGILIELRAEAAAVTQVVIGLGLNVQLPPTARAALERERGRVSDLAELAGGRPPSRNELAARLIGALIDALGEFERTGFAAFRPIWLAHDACAGQPVELAVGARSIAGIARGVAADGALLVEVDGRLERFVSGDVSLRA